MAGQTDFEDITFIGGESGLARFIGRPVKRFLAVEAAGGVLLLIATAVALIWANSPWSDSYFDLWHAEVDIRIGSVDIFHHELEALVNDALMVLFFFVVGLEIKRELVDGQLRNPRDAALPALGAVGGMVIPALLYFFVNIGGPGQSGWGIPMATDIAFAVGIVALLGSRIPRQLKIFLLTLAIVDDIGAIAVIAIFYSSGLSLTWLIVSLVTIAVIVVLKRLRVWYIPLYVAIGMFLWWATFNSGVHATIAGVILGLLTPAKPLQDDESARDVAEWLRDKPEVFVVDVRWASFRIRESVSVAERLNSALHPMTSYIIIPIFALANAGVRLNGDILSAASTSRVTIGIILGLIVGKTVGITFFTWMAAKLKLANMPRSMTMTHLVGLSMVAAIGFTVSLFVGSLAFNVEGDGEVAAGEVIAIETIAEGAGGEFEGATIEDEAKIGILFASAFAAVAGLAILSRAKGPRSTFDSTDDE